MCWNYRKKDLTSLIHENPKWHKTFLENCSWRTATSFLHPTGHKIQTWSVSSTATSFPSVLVCPQTPILAFRKIFRLKPWFLLQPLNKDWYIVYFSFVNLTNQCVNNFPIRFSLLITYALILLICCDIIICRL